jgi:hypothetical protein
MYTFQGYRTGRAADFLVHGRLANGRILRRHPRRRMQVLFVPALARSGFACKQDY